ncbi:MAG: BON domain-containing protein [Gemmataceae bacterium]|nr:BON domain-containing protein [Gemmataceae bacterium]
MIARKYFIVALALWLGWAVNGYGQQGPLAAKPLASPGVVPYQPPTLAQTIARTLQESGQLARYRVNVSVQNGVVELTGEVADESQREIVGRLVRATPGVGMVRDYVQVRTEGGVVSTQVIQPIPFPLPFPQPFDKNKPGKGPERIDGQLPEPTPIFQAPFGPNPTMQPPPMPPYAWPTFAPYNNYSRVAYPQAHNYEQFPFIGPMYPFPRVPLGWRSVSLTWEDGNWWYHRNPTGHDWWRIRYW